MLIKWKNSVKRKNEEVKKLIRKTKKGVDLNRS